VHTGTDPGGRVEVSIRDSGIGMSREVLERLFVPFEQGTAETVRRYGGLGLGMAISKALMDAQGGTIRAQSPGASQGSTFTVALPWVEKPDGSDTPAVAAQPAQPRRPLNILIVEDHPDTARVMSRLLGNLGHHVTIANSVASGLDAVAANPFDLLLSDIGLPDGTGMDFIRQVRKTSSLPAIALTGFGMEEDVAKCREAGFNHHLTKPVNFQRLESIIDNAAGDGARPGA
jgi:hypothetical protein